MEFDDEIREFLIESQENLANLDREILQLEQNPTDVQLISSAFRTIHTIKGTCGFFGYDILGSVTHVTENILSQVREGQRELTPALISLVLEAVDAVKALLASIEATGGEGEDATGPLRGRLEEAHRLIGAPAVAAVHASVPSAPAIAAPAALASATTATVTISAAALEPAPSVAQPASQAQLEALSVKPSPAPSSAPSAAAPVAGSGPPLGAPEPDSGREAQLADSTIRVDVALLNRLMNLVGELVLARNQLLQDASSHNSSLQQTSQRLNLITSELQEGVMKTRMQPIGVVWNKLPRVVRDLAAQCGKRIQIEMEGASTELDKTIIEAIKDPLTHIVRNACDHGIEMPEVRTAQGKKPEGLLLMRAYHEGGVVNIEISDDGAGINPDRVKAKAVEKGLVRAEQAALLSERDALHLIFLPGFSTAAAITSISGRGVGMDVVKTNIEKIGGSVEVQNRTGSGAGTVIRIKIPLTLAIIPGLVVTLRHAEAALARAKVATTEIEVRRHAGERSRPGECEEERFIIPQANLLELVRLEGADQLKRIENVHGTPIFHHRSKLLPLVYLAGVLGWRKEPAQCGEAVSIIVVQAENRQMGLVVDRICDTQEIVVKPLGRQLQGLASYVGATIMGDGRPALILDVAGLARLAGLGSQARKPAPSEEPLPTISTGQPEMLLLFRSGGYERVAVPLALVDRLEEIGVDKIEQAAGRPVLHYRGEILPLVAMGSQFQKAHTADSHVQVIVFAIESRRLGLVVDQILDIVHEPVVARLDSQAAAGLLGSAVIAGRITDLLDPCALVSSTGDARSGGAPRSHAPFPPALAPAWFSALSLEAVAQ